MKKKHLLLTAMVCTMAAIFTHAQNVPNYVPQNGLVGWWPFNGNANDESGNENNGTVNGATLTTDRFGNVNRAYDFDGGDWIEVPNSASLNSASTAITICSWFKIGNWYDVTDGNNGWFPIISKSNTESEYGNYRTGLVNTQGNISFYSNLNSDGFGTQVPLQPNTWNQIITTINTVSSLASVYLNGTLVYQGSTSNTGWSTTNTMPLLFGIDRPGLLEFAIGSIDDIGIWNRALSEEEIKNIYNGNICYQNVTVTDTLLINTNITGFNPITYQNTIKVYPNPSKDQITVDFGNFNTLNGYQLKITNSIGQQMYQTAINKQSVNISLGSWTGKGLYIIQIIDKQGTITDTRKIMIQ